MSSQRGRSRSSSRDNHRDQKKNNGGATDVRSLTEDLDRASTDSDRTRLLLKRAEVYENYGRFDEAIQGSSSSSFSLMHVSY
jgi:hypothetical protein